MTIQIENLRTTCQLINSNKKAYMLVNTSARAKWCKNILQKGSYTVLVDSVALKNKLTSKWIGSDIVKLNFPLTQVNV